MHLSLLRGFPHPKRQHPEPVGENRGGFLTHQGSSVLVLILNNQNDRSNKTPLVDWSIAGVFVARSEGFEPSTSAFGDLSQNFT
jgi:hypothetical protein